MHYLGQLPDLPLPGTGAPGLRTRRKALAQIVLCQGCCCGQTERGLPGVPLDVLKPIWKSEKLNKVVQLTVSGCLGPCDLPNVCCIVTPQEQTWYGRLTTTEDYQVLVQWARQCRERNELVPLPAALDHLRFERWPDAADVAPFTAIAQDPADIVLLTAADTEILTWSAAVVQLPAGAPSVRALNIDRLRDRRVFDAYLDDVLQDSRVLLVRVLGGLSYWREQLEALHVLARAHQIHLLCLPGDASPDPDLARLCTVPLPVADRAWRYCVEGGPANGTMLLRYLSDTLLGTSLGSEAPASLPEVGYYHPTAGSLTPPQAASGPLPPCGGGLGWGVSEDKPHSPAIDGRGDNEPSAPLSPVLRGEGSSVRGKAPTRVTAAPLTPGPSPRVQGEGRPCFLSNRSVVSPPRAAVLFYRAHWVTGNLAAVDALIHALEQRGFQAVGVFGPHVNAILDAKLLWPGQVDVLLTTTSFNALGATGLAALDVPILQAIFCASSANVWAANIAGLTPRDVAMNVALPEFDGRIITTAVSFKDPQTHDAALQTEVIRYQPRPDRVAHVADLARNWARLRQTANADKRLAFLLANYPSKNARVGNAVGLDTPASLHVLLTALRDAGYDTGPSLPADGQALMEALIAASTQDEEFATEAAFRQSVGQVTRAQVDQWLQACPASARAGICSHPVPDDAGDLPIPGLLLGNVFLGIQPARGYDQDPAAVYHSPDLPPPPRYFAFYRWLRDVFDAHAVIHLGKHGNLEWLPGKSAALSNACYPEVVLRDLPNIYPYIINNPGEGTQAKRRSAAVIVDHLIPPMTRADTYGDLRRLENLLDEYYTVQSLDPGKMPLVLAQIGRLIEDTALYRDFERDQAPTAEELPAFLGRVDGYLCEIKEAQIRDGLHVLGKLPEGEQLVDLLLALVRIDNGAVPGLPRALAEDLGLDYAALRAEPTAPAPPSFCILHFAFCTLHCRSNADVLEGLEALARHLISVSVRDGSVQSALTALRHECKMQNAKCKMQSEQTLGFLWESLWPRLQRCRDEMDHVLHALSGRFVPPGPSGAPTRGTADVLPTGRNFYSLDVRTIPTPSAWTVGCAAADALLEKHRERTGAYPESVALVIWGTSNMRTGGDDIAEVLALLGVKPRWDDANRRVVGLDLIPLTELGRPRIDVTVRISGLFRDAFPNLVRLLNDAVNLVTRLAEPLDRNFLKAHIARDTARLTRGERALSVEEASRQAALRVFGSKPGAYGAGLLPLIDGRNWESVHDLADVYLAWSSYAYTGAADDGREERDAFRLRLSQTEVVAQNQDNREHDIFDSDDYFQFHGGTIAAIRALTGAAPAAYLGDTSRPDEVKARTLREEACRVFRARVVNPRWLAGVMRHGYKGAVEMAATVDYLFGYDATAEVLDDWMYERLAETYLFDDAVRDFLRRANPWAERAMIERLLEAAARGLWEAPDAATLAKLRQQHGGNDAWLEGAPPASAEGR